MLKIKLNKEIFIFCVVLFIIVIEVFLLLPVAVKSTISINKKISAVKKDIIAIEKDWPLKSAYIQKISQLTQQISNLNTKYISPQQISSLLSFISSESKKFNIEIQQIKPANLQKKESLKLGAFSYIPIDIALNANFHDLKAFLEYLQNSNYFFEITKIDITSEPPLHKINLTICGLLKE
ncbi:MAG: type 4a pilus biogenesis protein PilO [Candidatus Omnitrophica bacterium]|nr:type 4a pilus biogenesis protein PilO [Candidatus Omnitrophota bacterium]MCM8831154.1 type 4a pilus biogenesis protein PilO [Candidatus Omnitrophota bacterium]